MHNTTLWCCACYAHYKYQINYIFYTNYVTPPKDKQEQKTTKHVFRDVICFKLIFSYIYGYQDILYNCKDQLMHILNIVFCYLFNSIFLFDKGMFIKVDAHYE